MSVASEISRLQTAKADLKTAIENKGVTVPASTTIDGYADLVSQISGGGGGHGLPAEYQEVTWLYGSNGGYIELPFGFDPTCKVEIKGEIVENEADHFLVSGYPWNNSNNRFGMLSFRNDRTLMVGFGSVSTNTTTLSGSYGDLYIPLIMQYEDGMFTCGTVYKDVSNIAFGARTTAIRLFHTYNGPQKGKIYHFKLTRDTEEHELYPCYRKSDLVAGMYDIKTNAFYTNETGVLTVGEDIL